MHDPMSRTFWNDAIETFVLEGPMNEETQSNFISSTSAVIAGNGALSFALPEGYQVAGEGFEYAVGEGDTYYYQPALKGVERTWGSVTGWSMIPCVVRLTMDTLELVDIIDLLPSEPTIANYRDASLRSGEPHFVDGLDNLPDFCAWGRIGDCASGSEFSTTGRLHAVLRIGNWLIPQISNSNQCYAYNLVTEEYWRLEGWNDMPNQLLQADPQIDLEFEAYSHERSWYNVLGSVGEGKALILREVQEREASIVSNFRDALTPEATVGSETVRDYFFRKWVNSSGTNSVVYSGDPEDWYDGIAYNWDLPDVYAGDLFGEPWGSGPYKPPYADIPENTRDFATTEAEFIAAIQTDLDNLVSQPRFNGVRTVTAVMELQIWDFSGESPVYIDTVYTWNDETVPSDPILRGETEYSITPTTFASLPLRDAGGAFSDDYYVIDVTTNSTHYRRTDSNFTLGAGVMVHSITPFDLGSNGDRWIVQSEDINNAPGPSGPALFKIEIDPGGIKRDENCLLTVLETPIVSNPLLAAQPEWHSGNFVSNGEIAIFLPRLSQPGIIRCFPLQEEAPSWSIDTLDHIEADPEESTDGACISNGVLTAQFLYAVIRNESQGKHILFKIRIYDLLDEEEEIIEPAGTVVLAAPIIGTVGSNGELHRDNLLAVNRRLLAFDFEGNFFEIEIE